MGKKQPGTHIGFRPGTGHACARIRAITASTPQQGLQPRRAMGIRRGIGQFRRRMSAFVACRFPSPAASLSSLLDHRTGIAMTAFSFVTRHVFAWCVFYLVVLLMWTSFGLPE